MQTTITRSIFLILSLLFSLFYVVSIVPEGNEVSYLFMGAIAGCALGGFIIILERSWQSVELRSWNAVTVGLVCGWLMASVLLLVLHTIVGNSLVSESVMLPVRASLFLIAAYLGVMIALRKTDSLLLTIPFIQFGQQLENQKELPKKKRMLIDGSLLSDQRFVELASSGLLDSQLIIPRSLIKEFYEDLESIEENCRSKGRRGLDALKKLESLIGIDLEYADLDFSEIKDSSIKNLCLARLLNSNIFTADPLHTSHLALDGVKIINLHHLMATCKPLAQIEDFITIKIQHYGKGPRQGVGYLEDGSMVVVNGGAEHVGEAIRAHVLSVKHTTSGRMIFCNTVEVDEHTDPLLESVPATVKDSYESNAKSYFSV